MRKVLAIATVAAGALLLCVVSLLAYSTVLQRRTASALAIQSPNGIQEAGYERIGGLRQWIQIRSQDRRNPVLLCLNGGPGASWIPLTPWFRAWERRFTVVQWDQRGEGKTLESTGPSIASTMTIDTMSHDGIEVAEFVRRRLGAGKVVLLGHSWGSILGIHMIKARPDLFAAYVGTGQVGDLSRSLRLSYAVTLARAKAAHDDGTAGELTRIGPPPYDEAHMQNVATLFGALGAYAPASDREIMAKMPGAILSAPNYSLRDIQYRNAGFTSVPPASLYLAMEKTDLLRLGPDFKVPVYFFAGDGDNVTVLSETKRYFDQIRAPRKALVVFPGGGHFVVWSMSDRFLAELISNLAWLSRRADGSTPHGARRGRSPRAG